MTTLTTPVFGFEYPEGDEPISNIDDLWEKFALRIEEVINNMQRSSVSSLKLQWFGTLAMVSGADIIPKYTTYADETEGEGNLPIFSYTAGITIPSTGLWHVEGYNQFDYTGVYPGTTTVTVETGLNEDNGRAGTTALVVAPNPSDTQLRMSWNGWLKENTVVRAFARVSGAGCNLKAHHVRLVGPLNVAQSGTPLLRHPHYPVSSYPYPES